MRYLNKASLGCLSLMLSLMSFSDVSASDYNCGLHFKRHHHKHHDEVVWETPTSSFGAFYTDSQDTIAENTIIPMEASENNSPDVVLESGYITINKPGFYFVNFGASQVTSGNALEVALFLNGEQIENAVVSSNPAPSALVTFSTIIAIGEGDQLTMQNINGTDLDLGTGISGDPTAFITLFKLSDLPRLQ